MLILGLSSLYKNHAAAALVRDGVIVAALENYKLQPNAPWGIPEAAIQYCLSNGGVAWGDIDVVAIASDPFRGWRRRALSRRYLSPVAPVDTCYQQGKELSRIVKEWTGIRVLRQRMQDTRKVGQPRPSLLPRGQRLFSFGLAGTEKGANRIPWANDRGLARKIERGIHQVRQASTAMDRTVWTGGCRQCGIAP